MTITENKTVCRVTDALVKLALLWVYILLHNATNEGNVWRIRRLQAVNIGLLWVSSWLYEKWREGEQVSK